MLTWAIAWVIVSGAATWPLLLAGILGDIVLTASIGANLKRPPVANTYNLNADDSFTDEEREKVNQWAASCWRGGEK